MITLADVDAVFPGSVTEPVAGTIRVEVEADNVAELVSSLLEAAAQAQETYNANPANVNNQLDAFPLPAPGVPTRQADGSYVVTYTYTVAIDAPVNLGAATGSRV